VKNKNNTVGFGNARFTFYSDIAFKAEYSPDGMFIDRELFVTDINSVCGAALKVLKTARSVKIRTAGLLVEYRPSAKDGFSGKNLKVSYLIKGKRKTWRYGMKDLKNLGGAMLHLFKYPSCTKPGDLQDGVISKNGFFAYYDTTHNFWDKKNVWASVKYKKGYQTLFFIGYGSDFRAGLREYARIFGRCSLPPVWALGFWYSRWHPYNQDEFIGIVEKYRKLKIPIDVMVVDTDWREKRWGGYDIAKKYFYDWRGFIGKMKKLGIKLAFNDHPGYNESEPLPEDDSHFARIREYLKKNIKGPWRCNWAKKNEVRAFIEILLKPMIRAGVDFWWVDGWGADGISVNEQFFKKHVGEDRMSLGVKGYEKINPQLWLNHFYSLAAKEATKKRALILSRWGGIGSHRYPVQFSGDTFSNWETLAYEVFFTSTGGNILANYWSHDIGGFLGRAISKELFLRWVQFGCFSPIMRTHSTLGNGIREPWKFDKETIDTFRKYVRLRYRLVPYLYTYAAMSFREALPWVRAMYHNYPDDSESYVFKHQYMLGDDILVAPVVEPLKGRATVLKKIFFPDGEWIDPENGDVYRGKSINNVAATLSKIPFFIRRGAILPVSRNLKYIGEKKNDVLRFEIFPSGKSIFRYYEDDGLTENYRKGGFAEITVTVQSGTKNIIVDVGKIKGTYRKLKLKRRLQIVLHTDRKNRITGAAAGKNLNVKRAGKVLNELMTPFLSVQTETSYDGARGKRIKFFLEKMRENI